MTTLAAAVAHELAAGGVRHAFGVVGGGNILAAAGLTEHGVRYVAARHEGGAMAMADAYHRVSGSVAVCTTSHGAGITNTATALAEAARHGSGIVVLCGDHPVSGLRRCDVDQTTFARTLGAEVVRVRDAGTARADAAEALRLARALSRPVLLCLPNDLLNTEVPERLVFTVDGEGTSGAGAEAVRAVGAAPTADDVGAVLELLSTARRPLVLAGLGAWRADAGKPVADLAVRAGALLATTVMANGLFSGNRFALGICGGFAAPRAAELIKQADLVLAFGADLDPFTLHGGRLLDPGAPVVRIDNVPRTRVAPVSLEITADASVAASALTDAMNAANLPTSAWRDANEDLLPCATWADQAHPDASTVDRIDPRTLTKALGDLLPAERTVVFDGGHFISWPSMYWSVPDPAAMVFMGGAFQAIGLGFAGAVGAASGRADRLTVVALGDGGSLMGLPELDTLIRSESPVLVVIYDDASYGFEAHLYTPRGADPRTASFADTDFAGVALALGAEVAVVRAVPDLDAVRDWQARGPRGVLVLDCKVVPDVIAPFLSDLIAGH
ncbi:thiamine pyrophosphate-binding protein [Actinophytocola glycyrrhizae]|uniref:Thiamine pyrophosphate-binding protein n=1 Tax=Actinophytocola glycyrrhizae TaxID=2044873 RepID=A0ABV9S764_9PSEU